MPRLLIGLGRASYKLGYKYCTRCAVFYYTDLRRCPNCGSLLRHNPRKSRKEPAKQINPPPEILQEAATVKVHIKHRGKEAEER